MRKRPIRRSLRRVPVRSAARRRNVPFGAAHAGHPRTAVVELPVQVVNAPQDEMVYRQSLRNLWAVKTG